MYYYGMKREKSIKEVNNRKWVTAVARRHTPLLLSIAIAGEQDTLLIKQQTGLSLTFSYMRRNGLALQYDKDELVAGYEVVRNEVSKNGLSFFETYSLRCIQSCNEFLQITNIAKEQYRKNPNPRILKTQLQCYFGAAVSHATHLIVLISVEYVFEDFLNKFVTGRIGDSSKREKILASFKIAIEPTHEISNLERLLELGEYVQFKVPHYKEWIVCDPQILSKRMAKESPEIWKRIKRYQNDFGWMGRMYYAGNPIIELDIIIRLQNILHQNCRERLKKIRLDRERQITEREHAITELGGDKEARLLADIVARYMHLRTYRLNVYFMAHEQVLELLYKAAQRLGLRGGVDDIIYLDWREIIEGLEGKQTSVKLQHNVDQRKQGFEFLSIKGKTVWLSKDLKNSTTLKGTIACRGNFTGRVRLILNDKAMQEMLPGEILVTTMTTPSLMLAVEKAGAIVTDEGGMLCHAAVVSRELNIPCVIGTQRATKVLKDGDVIEVDAVNGIVKKVSQFL
jgi:phosphohistidine swiveling domain-containing protein